MRIIFRPVSETKIHNLFNKYRDSSSGSSSEDAILIQGVESLCQDLELRPEEFNVLVFAWKCRAEQMCRFTRQEFLNGCRYVVLNYCTYRNIL